HLRKRDEACVANNEVDGLGNMVGSQNTRTRLFMNDDALVLAQLPRQLIGARIDRIDPHRAAAQQHVGETPGRRAYVDRDRAGDIPAEVCERMVELDAAARYPWMIAALHAELGVCRDLLSGFFDPAVADEGEPREDQRLRARPAFGKAAIDEKLIGAQLCHQLSTSSVSVPGVRICGRMSGASAPGAYQR